MLKLNDEDDPKLQDPKIDDPELQNWRGLKQKKISCPSDEKNSAAIGKILFIIYFILCS